MAKSDTGRKRVTLTDVARAAGVSKSTVSLVLNDSSLIKKETQQKVQQAIEQLGYVYNRFAANLRSQKSLTIGVVIDDLINPFFAEFTMGLEMTLAEHGFITVMSNTSQRSDRQKQVLDTLLEHHVAGIVLCPVNSTSEADLQRYANSSTPLLITMRPLDWQQLPVDYVGVDSHAGVREATEYLIQQGHRDIVFIGGLTHHMRYQGYLEAMNHHGLQPWSTDAFSLRAEPTQANGYQLMQQLLDMPSPPTAVICYNDLMAFGAESALGERGLFAGEDISLIGNDGVAACAYSNPPLTTIAVEPLTLGKQAAQQILRRIAQPDAPLSHYIYRPTLQIRASTGKRGR
ncbi:LacI family DNA-binding transcriptional regulator [Escherichia coli]|uniref:LacI family DNA-binding transcriptional regulator n=1 Tax=Escherichia coli TaxID=562 RepID=UPI000B7EEFBD|nr:LacI family DNA-binding transcriptional regulator [Escherichia coli]EFB1773974.1 LacI family DNA-binding transcriptional regulator [Escherichia coli]EFC5425834.1 substrate-binding domain-containing protein [Escherichia coli]EFH9482775.1 LacI family DNA-binding transcriptional regulator [Escherichia coli]EFN8556375.1 LacI family DNA-binding transcriptional regulator [Escherichia coli]EGK3483422.1 substrate-binding domain-containing protein [Escherichia coli]